MEDSLVKPPEQ